MKETMQPGFLAALTFPFREKDVVQKIWWLPLVNFVPVLNLILMRGWRVSVVRRMGRHEAQFLPEPHNLGRFLADGTILWIMTGLYLIPQIILLAIFGQGAIDNILTILLWIFNTLFTDNPTIALSVLITDVLLGTIMQLIIPGAYWLLSWPVYRAAMIRFSTTGRVWAFFDIITNIKLVARHLDEFMLTFFWTLAMNALIGFVSGLFISTAIGSILVPLITIPMFYWTTGYIYGRLAAKLNLTQLPDASTVSPNGSQPDVTPQFQ
jgi:hypothetical protein